MRQAGSGEGEINEQCVDPGHDTSHTNSNALGGNELLNLTENDEFTSSQRPQSLDLPEQEEQHCLVRPRITTDSSGRQSLQLSPTSLEFSLSTVGRLVVQVSNISSSDGGPPSSILHDSITSERVASPMASDFDDLEVGGQRIAELDSGEGMQGLNLDEHAEDNNEDNNEDSSDLDDLEVQGVPIGDGHGVGFSMPIDLDSMAIGRHTESVHPHIPALVEEQSIVSSSTPLHHQRPPQSQSTTDIFQPSSTAHHPLQTTNPMQQELALTPFQFKPQGPSEDLPQEEELHDAMDVTAGSSKRETDMETENDGIGKQI